MVEGAVLIVTVGQDPGIALVLITLKSFETSERFFLASGTYIRPCAFGSYAVSEPIMTTEIRRVDS